MIKLIIFDLDGVLVDAKEIHFNALNKALKQIAGFQISLEEHLTKFDGLPTATKLSTLVAEGRLDPDLVDRIKYMKGNYTLDLSNNKNLSTPQIKEMLVKLRKDGYIIYVASNSIESTVFHWLHSSDLFLDVDYYLGNDQVKHPKPSPQMFLQAMIDANVGPNQTLIVEDSPVGLQAAEASGAHVLRVENPYVLNYELIKKTIGRYNSIVHKKRQKTWQAKDELNIVIPMAGRGSRFEAAGYTFPKPLIDVNGKPMIQTVVENLNINANYTFIVQKEHYDKYNLEYMLRLIAPECNIVTLDHITDGAARTTLLAKEFIDNNKQLLLVNSDQYVVWDSTDFMYSCLSKDVDGSIVVFNASHPKWSFAKTNDKGYVIEVAEKKPISDLATVGIYWWRKGSDYVKYAEQMIEKDIRTNMEFYVAPVYNQAIEDGKKISTFKIDKMYGLGTPEDLQLFLKENNV